MIDIDELRFSATNSVRDLALLPSEVLELLDRLEAAEKERDSLRADKATLQQMTYSLKDRLEAAEKELAELRSSMKFRTSLIGRTEAERDALRAKIEEMEKQEPVATVIKKGDSRYWMSERLWTFPDGKYPLYVLPGAQGE